MKTHTVGSLFSGIGGFDLAARWAGFETAWFVEKESFCQQVLSKHWPGVPVYGDIYETHGLPYVDVITAGFPCQPFSVAGKRMGSDDERFLIPEMLRVIDDVQPRMVFLENVPGFASLNDGAEFKELLRALAEMGFDAQWGHIRASDVGAPHRRERWFLLAYANSGNSHRRTKPVEGRANRIKVGSAELDYSASIRRARHQPQPGSVSAGENDGRLFKLTRTGENVGNAGGSGRQKQHAAPITNGTGHAAGRPDASGRNGDIESRLGRTHDGLSGGLDFPGFPAKPGEPQHDYEPPRVVPSGQGNRASRIKALGNAIVPQVVYPQFVTIREWLDSQKAGQGCTTIPAPCSSLLSQETLNDERYQYSRHSPRHR